MKCTRDISNRLTTLLVVAVCFGSVGCSKGKLINGRNSATPEIIKIVPNNAALVGGVEAAIIGRNFVKGATIKLGDTECRDVEYVSELTITCHVPKRDAAERVDVVVTNPNAKSSVLKLGFAYIESLEGAPGYAITAGGGVTQGTARRAVSSIGEIGTPNVQRGTSRMVVGGIHATF